MNTSELRKHKISNGLLRRLDLREVAAVLAHEISHIRNNDTRIMSFADLGAAELTGDPEALASALNKMAHFQSG